MNDGFADSVVLAAKSKVIPIMMARAQKIYAYMQALIAVSILLQRMNIKNGKQDEMTSLLILVRNYISISQGLNEAGNPTILVSVNLLQINKLLNDQRVLFVDLFHRAKTKVFSYA